MLKERRRLGSNTRATDKGSRLSIVPKLPSIESRTLDLPQYCGWPLGGHLWSSGKSELRSTPVLHCVEACHYPTIYRFSIIQADDARQSNKAPSAVDTALHVRTAACMRCWLLKAEQCASVRRVSASRCGSWQLRRTREVDKPNINGVSEIVATSMSVQKVESLNAWTINTMLVCDGFRALVRVPARGLWRKAP